MNRRIFTMLLVAATTSLMAGSAGAVAQGNSGNHGHSGDKEHEDGNGHGRSKGDDHEDGDHHDNGDHEEGSRDSRRGQRYFRDQDNVYLTRYYDGPRDLPPGLRKKYYRNQALPPGWQRRFRPMPQQLVVQLPPVPNGYERGYYDGYAVLVDPRTRVIMDAVDILGALSGR